MYRLIYVSQPVPELKVDDIDDLLAKARHYNTRHAVSGVLYFGSGYFLQTLEGPLIEVNTVFRHIARDPRHHSVSLLKFGARPDRTCLSAMAYLGPKRQVGLDVTASFRNVGGDFVPEHFSEAEALRFMLEVSQLAAPA